MTFNIELIQAFIAVSKKPQRMHSSKKHEYEKRKHSPHHNRSSSSSLSPPPRSIPSFHENRYPGPNSHPPRFDSPPKKKINRDVQRFQQVVNPPGRLMDRGPSHVVPEGHSTLRKEANILPTTLPLIAHDLRATLNPISISGQSAEDTYRLQPKSHFGYGAIPSVIGNREPEVNLMKPSYERESINQYPRNNNHSEKFSSAKDKHSTTLDERFRSVTESNLGPEQRTTYTREDLEKITIDIRTKSRDRSPTVRHILNPANVKIVRRANEGRHQIFDREEIKQAPRDLREDAYFEHKMMVSIRETGMSSYGINTREMENYEITRHRFDPYHTPLNLGSGQSLSDRWQQLETRKDPTALDRDDREKEYERAPESRIQVAERQRRSGTGDRDFRVKRFQSAPEPSHAKPTYDSTRSHRSPGPPDLRHDVTVRKKSSAALAVRPKMKVEREREYTPPRRSRSHSRYNSRAEKRFARSPDTSRERHSSRHFSDDEHSKWDRSRDRSRSKERLPDFSRRPDKYNYKPWLEKPDMTPRGSSYFEHDSREGSQYYRSRSRSRPFRTRGYRGRNFRAGFRGSFRGRTPFRGFRGARSPRGRGFPSRRGRFSPSLWEHDLYSKESQDRKSKNRDSD